MRFHGQTAHAISLSFIELHHLRLPSNVSSPNSPSQRSICVVARNFKKGSSAFWVRRAPGRLSSEYRGILHHVRVRRRRKEREIVGVVVALENDHLIGIDRADGGGNRTVEG